jgi:class 3 adenylate cyclase/CheY-like chemotaxis protein
MDPPDAHQENRTFQLLRPAKFGGPLTDKLSELERAESELAGRDAAILVVDDSTELRQLLKLILNEMGYANVTEAEDGEAALELLQKQEFDLLILDIDMPRLDGYGVLSALRNDPQRRHMPVLVASGNDDLDAVVHCIEFGAEDYLPKPVNAVILRARIAASLERKRLRDLERVRLAELQVEKQLLETEREKSERLLLNILPTTIAQRLKQGSYPIVERFAHVTVLFADLIGFTGFANRTDPEEMVSLLNDLFSRFDRIAERHGVEKIKTIGDSYLVVGGLPEPMPDHAVAVAETALEMLTAFTELNGERGTDLQIRFGLNSGPVVAGVIGHKKFTYDLWGTAVNIASRMQSSGLPNRIQLPAEMLESLQGKFRLTERGVIDCKGLGKIRTYLLDGKSEQPVGAKGGGRRTRKPAQPADPAA